MVAFLSDWATAVWITLCDAGPYLLLGLIVAGFIQALVPRDKILRHFGGNDLRSVLKAALVGIPVPLCSCSVIPTAIQLRRSGASKGATAAFLISTPETGVDSIGVTWALLDPLMTFARPIAALITAVGTGTAVNWIVRREWDGQASEDAGTAEVHTHDSDAVHDHDHGHDGDHPEARAHAAVADTRAPRRGFVATARAALRYAFGDMLDDLSAWLIAGFLVSGLIIVLVPDNFFGDVLPLGWPSMLVMLVIGMPLYVCASATTPIAAALIAKGLDPGAALVLLLAGPATNLATMAIVSRFLGRRVLVVYIVGITGFSLFCGAMVDRIYANTGPIKIRAIEKSVGADSTVIAIIGGAVILFLLLRSAQRTRLASSIAQHVRRWCAPLGFDPFSGAVRSLLVIAVMALYASTGFTAVGPGETVFVLRFGALHAQRNEPGLVVHLPFPIDRVERVNSDEVRTATFGFDENGPQPAVINDTSGDRTAESEIVAGDETILRVTYAVHYRISDPLRFRFGVVDADKALRAAAESSARRMIGHRRAEAVLVESRQAMQTEMLGILHEELASLDVGIEPVAVHLVYVHVPQRVHEAYLDVASALENKEGSIRAAEKYRLERQAQARGMARAAEEGALAKQSEILGKANGEAAAFDSVRAAHTIQPEIDRSRRVRAALASALERASLVLLLSGDVDVRLIDTNLGAGSSSSSDGSDPRTSKLPEAMDER